jgi:hypothetical protein
VAFNWTLDPIKYGLLTSAYNFKSNQSQNIRIGKFSLDSEKGAENSFDSYPTEFVEVKNVKISFSPLKSPNSSKNFGNH